MFFEPFRVLLASSTAILCASILLNAYQLTLPDYLMNNYKRKASRGTFKIILIYPWPLEFRIFKSEVKLIVYSTDLQLFSTLSTVGPFYLDTAYLLLFLASS